MFSNVETASGFDKLFLITTKQHLDIARKWVDDLINAMINEKLTPADMKELIGHDKVFQRVDQLTSTDAEKVYSALMMQDLKIGGLLIFQWALLQYQRRGHGRKYCLDQVSLW